MQTLLRNMSQMEQWEKRNQEYKGTRNTKEPGMEWNQEYKKTRNRKEPGVERNQELKGIRNRK